MRVLFRLHVHWSLEVNSSAVTSFLCVNWRCLKTSWMNRIWKAQVSNIFENFQAKYPCFSWQRLWRLWDLEVVFCCSSHITDGGTQWHVSYFEDSNVWASKMRSKEQLVSFWTSMLQSFSASTHSSLQFTFNSLHRVNLIICFLGSKLTKRHQRYTIIDKRKKIKIPSEAQVSSSRKILCRFRFRCLCHLLKSSRPADEKQGDTSETPTRDLAEIFWPELHLFGG